MYVFIIKYFSQLWLVILFFGHFHAAGHMVFFYGKWLPWVRPTQITLFLF